MTQAPHVTWERPRLSDCEAARSSGSCCILGRARQAWGDTVGQGAAVSVFQGGQLWGDVRQETEGGQLVCRCPWWEHPLSPWGREGTFPCELHLLLSGAERRVRVSSVDLVFLRGLSFKMVSIPKWHISGCQDLLPCNTSPPSAWKYSEHSRGCSGPGHAEAGSVRCPSFTVFPLQVRGCGGSQVSSALGQATDAVVA